VIRFVDKDKKLPRHSASPTESQPPHGSDTDDVYRRVPPEMRRPKPSPDAIAAALEAAQRLAAEADSEQGADDAAELSEDVFVEDDLPPGVCHFCQYHNRDGNKFCGMCGTMIKKPSQPESANPPHEEHRHTNDEHRPSRALALPPTTFLEPERDPGSRFSEEERPAAHRPTGQETHHYHHHYHHHYFPGGQEGMVPRAGSEPVRDPDKMRPTAALRGDMSRAEAAVRRVTHEWVLACNTKHLDDLLDLYVADALMLRSNYPPIRGAAAVREFFFGALDAGLGEVEIEPLRVEVVGDLAYEAGRCKALVPSASGKRREERGKYLWVCARQPNGEWKLAADCWSSDLTLNTMESDVPASTGVKSAQPRKTP